MDTVLFDLDGTLLPMDTKEYFRLYIAEVEKLFDAHGIPREEGVDALFRATGATVKNDGSATNEEYFWRGFEARLGRSIEPIKPQLIAFYENQFHAARRACRPNAQAARLVGLLRGAGYRVVLATNPLYPRCGVASRLSWLGMHADDFAHVTTFENSHFCKPNPAYYREILDIMGRHPEDCLMVGNDAEEDGVAADMGMDFFLVTDELLNRTGRDISGWKQGSFADCYAYISALVRTPAATRDTAIPSSP